MDSGWAFDESMVFIEDSQRAANVDELATSFDRLIRSLGFEEYLAVSLADPDHWPDDAIQLNGYSKTWFDIYVGERYFEIDPFYAKAQRQTMPFFWHDVRASMELSDRQKALMADAASANHATGMTVPIVVQGSYRSSVSVCTDRHDFAEGVPHAVHLSAMYLIEAAKRMKRRQFGPHGSSAGPTAAIIEPTDREGDVLQWLAHGKTAWEISQILNISERTVRYHINNTKKKFGVSTTMQAVVRALIQQHISG